MLKKQLEITQKKKKICKIYVRVSSIAEGRSFIWQNHMVTSVKWIHELLYKESPYSDTIQTYFSEFTNQKLDRKGTTTKSCFWNVLKTE